MMTAKSVRLMVTAAAVALLSACGGGGDDAGPGPGTIGSGDAVDKYVGTWSGCFAVGAGSLRETVVITRSSATTGGFTWTETAHTGTTCAGTATDSDSGSGTFVMNGTKAIGADTVDKVTVTEGAAVEKQVFLVKGTAPAMLSLGRAALDGGPVDAEGYPTTLDDHTLAKQ